MIYSSIKLKIVLLYVIIFCELTVGLPQILNKVGPILARG